MQIARSSFYAWRAAAPTRAARQAADEALAARIRHAHGKDRACGVPRITVELNDGVPDDERVNHKRVARVMRERSIAGIRLRRRVRTTVPDPDAAHVPDLLERDFTASEPNTKYVGDITYLPCVPTSSSTWPRLSTASPGAWSAGRSPSTCAPTW